MLICVHLFYLTSGQILGSMFDHMTSGYGPPTMGNSTLPSDHELQKLYTIQSMLTLAKQSGLLDGHDHSVTSQNGGMQICLCL